jgi:ABC-2 type transport system ATP-binding protein
VLHGLDLSVPVGAVVGLLGPSGCGKSTLMRAIVGVQRVAGGEVDVLGLPAGSAALRSEVGYVTQAPSVYADLTVRQNLTYFARVMGAPPDDPGRVLANVGLNSAAEQLVGSLSGGQRARVSLATALLGHPRLLILDEPTVGLDPLLRRELWQRFRSLADSGVTLLVSSHVMDEAAHCDRLLLLRDGQLLADTEPHALLERTGPDNLENAFLRLLEQQDTTMEVVA